MDKFLGQAWIIWILLAALSGLLELLVPSFTFSFVSLGAAAAAAASIWWGWWMQTVVFAIALLGSLVVLRPILRRRFHVSRKMQSRSQRHFNLHGEVTEMIDATKGSGRILVSGEDWAARAESVIEVGRTVRVTGEDGIFLTVKEV